MLLIIPGDRWQKQWRATSYGRTLVYVHPQLGSILGKNLSNQFWSTCGYKKTLLTPLSERKGKKFANIWHKWRRMANCGGHNKWQNSMHGTPRLDFQLYTKKGNLLPEFFTACPNFYSQQSLVLLTLFNCISKLSFLSGNLGGVLYIIEEGEEEAIWPRNRQTAN